MPDCVAGRCRPRLRFKTLLLPLHRLLWGASSASAPAHALTRMKSRVKFESMMRRSFRDSKRESGAGEANEYTIEKVQLRDYDYFGEDALLSQDNKSRSSYRACVYTDVSVLLREDFLLLAEALQPESVRSMTRMRAVRARATVASRAFTLLSSVKESRLWIRMVNVSCETSAASAGESP